ncbi:5'-nucleotidase C-terminal domain-containing protein [bacterium]|nr:5'-nucleotidase C-terminal domain-containing protein [bacterium]
MAKCKIFILLLGLFITYGIAVGTQVHFALINDTHSILEPFGPRDDVTLEAEYGGYPRAVYILDSLRSAHPGILLLHAGDMIGGDFLSNITRGYASFDLWKRAGIQAFCLGNHEFEYGPDVLDSVLSEIDMPFLCANIVADEYPYLAASCEPYRLFGVPTETPGESIFIAVFGLCTEETETVGWTDSVDLTSTYSAITDIGFPAGADAAVLMPHVSFWEDTVLAKIPWIDAVLGAHDHYIMEEPFWVVSEGDSTPVVQAGWATGWVGHLTMDYCPGEGLRFISWELIEINRTFPENYEARTALNEYRELIIANPFVGLDPYENVVFYADTTISIRPVAPEGSGWKDSPAGNLVSDAYRAILGTDVALEGTGALRMDIYSGPVTHADLFRLVPNGLDTRTDLNANLITMEISGADLKMMMELVFFGADFYPELFPQLSGVNLSYDPEGPFLNRIDLDSWNIGGIPWNTATSYTMGASALLMIAFEASGLTLPEIDSMDITVYQALVNYCSDPSFDPSYLSEGRIIDIRSASIKENIKIFPQNLYCYTYPNPFNAQVNFEVPNNSQITVFDLNGRIVDRLYTPVIKNLSQEGTSSVRWSPGAEIPSGLYPIKISLGDQTYMTNVIYLK